MLLLSCPEKRVCDEGLAGCNTVVTLHFLKVPSPSRGFFPGQLGSCQPLRFGSAKRDKGSLGGREVLGGVGGAPGFFYYHSLGERRGGVTLCRCPPTLVHNS